MLVLTRKSEQKIVIGKRGKRIVITILKVQGDQVSIGIEADKDISIYRQELLEEIEAANTCGAIEIEKGPVDVKSLAKKFKSRRQPTVKNS